MFNKQIPLRRSINICVVSFRTSYKALVTMRASFLLFTALLLESKVSRLRCRFVCKIRFFDIFFFFDVVRIFVLFTSCERNESFMLWWLGLKQYLSRYQETAAFNWSHAATAGLMFCGQNLPNFFALIAGTKHTQPVLTGLGPKSVAWGWGWVHNWKFLKSNLNSKRHFNSDIR